MLEYLLLVVGLVRAALRARAGLVAATLVLRYQLAVLSRPARRRSRPRTRDKLRRALVLPSIGHGRRELVMLATLAIRVDCTTV